MSSIVVLRQDDRHADVSPVLWDLDPTLLSSLCAIADRAAEIGVGARLVTAMPRQRPKTLVTARWSAGNWQAVVDLVLQYGEAHESPEVAGAPVEGPGGMRGVFLLQRRGTEMPGVDLARSFALQVQQSLEHAASRLESCRATTQSLFQMVTAHDPDTGRHSQVVKRMALVLGTVVGIAPRELMQLERSALLHDVGKVHIPQALLDKAPPLSAADCACMREHPTLGEKLVRAIPELESCADAVRHHHERWDGTGYPDRLAGNAIPLEARILAIVDAYETIRAGRSYRTGRGRDAALAEMTAGTGRQFDPTLVELFVDIPSHVLGL